MSEPITRDTILDALGLLLSVSLGDYQSHGMMLNNKPYEWVVTGDGSTVIVAKPTPEHPDVLATIIEFSQRRRERVAAQRAEQEQRKEQEAV